MTTTTNQTLTRSVPLGKDSGKHFDVHLHQVIPADMLPLLMRDDPKSRLARDIILVGTSRIFVDVQASAKTDAERLGACNKKWDAWLQGEMNVRGGGGGGETLEGEVKRLVVAAYMERTGESESKALLKFKGRGYDVLRTIADAKAAALVPMPDELGPNPTVDEAGAHAALKSEAELERAKRATAFYEASKAAWDAKAKASLEAKAAARSATDGFDVADLLDPDADEPEADEPEAAANDEPGEAADDDSAE